MPSGGKVTHGMRGTAIYGIWSGMRTRCLSSNSSAFKNYGGRGIAICERWNDFANFYADMGDPPEGMTLERKNNDGPYSPDNCEWATRGEQAKNRRKKRLITADGVTKPLWQWAEESGLKFGTIHRRLKMGWSEQDAVTLPLIVKRKGVPKGILLRDAWKADRSEFNESR